MPKVGDMICSTPINEDPCQQEMIKVRNLKPSPGHGSTGRYAHTNRDIDAHYDVKKFMFQESLGGLRSVEQERDDYIRPNADLEMKLQITSEAKKYVSRIWYAIGDF